MTSPFPTATSTPGQGTIDLIQVPPLASALRQFSYQYPLKLVAPAPLTSDDEISIQTVYLLSYGGGLVGGDSIDLNVSLDHGVRLILLTQGSTKIFKSPSPAVLTSQLTTVRVLSGAGLCYLPDPVQPFEKSCFEQKQTYHIKASIESGTSSTGSMCVLDWVSQGRTARGENWNMWRYVSRNDVWLHSGEDEHAKRRLLLRDKVILDPNPGGDGSSTSPSYAERMHRQGVFGTLILFGPLTTSLADFFHDEFKLVPRIGGRKWDGSDDGKEPTEVEVRRELRQRQEASDGLLWSVATLRGCTVVKFGAREVEGAKRWLKTMLETEGSVIRHYGERAMLCLR
ncbi:UreD urease accessory protein-domain-containing protein [Elsinoe ampelina]|uniref:UreD urease accessory protein-domain-containing protein n=1 Tax=Elsinoe ampelina TaxID=302913 RepID=A0A6A6GJF3_9PEZI|nr:UreD urease accessory protein-domain-containing protein [Elsinoe ampelina]